VQAGLGDPEVLRDLGQRSLALAGHRDDIAAELDGERLRHAEHPSSEERILTGKESTELGAVPMVEARLLAYASRSVLTALNETSDADSRFGAAFRTWLTDYARAKATQGSAYQLAEDDKANMMDAAEKARAMDDTLMNIIRAELNAGPGGGQ
jgi:hypothetical protein